MLNQPRISVLLAVYNGGHMLMKSVESVLNQDINDFEFLICEDCSNDDSLSYLKSIKDSRVQLFVNNENRGLFYNLNFLVSKSNSTIIKLWSQDDIMYSNCLITTIKFHVKHREISFSYSDCDVIDENDNLIHIDNFADNTPEIISPWLHNKIALYTGSITGNIANVTINKKILDKVGPFREDMQYSADLDMWERLTRDYNIGRINKSLIQLRKHKGQLSRKKGFTIFQLREDKEIFRRLVDRSPDDLKSYAKTAINWKRNVYYFAVLIGYIKKGQWRYAYEYYNELRDLDNIFLLFNRWVIVKLLTKFGLKIVKFPIQN